MVSELYIRQTLDDVAQRPQSCTFCPLLLKDHRNCVYMGTDNPVDDVLYRTTAS